MFCPHLYLWVVRGVPTRARRGHQIPRSSVTQSSKYSCCTTEVVHLTPVHGIPNTWGVDMKVKLNKFIVCSNCLHFYVKSIDCFRILPTSPIDQELRLYFIFYYFVIGSRLEQVDLPVFQCTYIRTHFFCAKKKLWMFKQTHIVWVLLYAIAQNSFASAAPAHALHPFPGTQLVAVGVHFPVTNTAD